MSSDANTRMAGRLQRVRDLEERVRQSRLERGMLTTQVLRDHPEVTIESFAQAINAENERNGVDTRQSAQDLRECVREYEEHIRWGGKDEDIVRSDPDAVR